MRETKILVKGVSSDEGQKPNAVGLKSTLDCADQE